MTFRSFVLLCVSILLGPVAVSAQDYLFATGSPAFSTNLPIDQGIVNVNNGEIHLEIPLVSKTQRGGALAIQERLIYDSRIWKIVQNGAFQWLPTNVPGSVGGWTFSSGLASGSITFSATGGSDPHSSACAGTTISQSYTDFHDWSWQDPGGTAHSFPGAETIQYSPPVAANCTGPSPSGVSNSSAIASDGSGYILQLTNFTTPTIISSDGTIFHPTLVANNPPAQSANIQDRNGNFWSNDGSGNLVDTNGTTPVLVSSSGNQTFYDVLGVGGVRQRYTVTTAPVLFNTAFNETLVNEASGSFNAIQTIKLPDGSQYSFTYDSSTSAGHYGEMTSMTLPTGGVINYTYTNFKDSFNNQNEWINTIQKDGGTTRFQPAVISQCSASAGCQEKVTVTHPDGNDTAYTFTLDKAGLVAGSSWIQNIASFQGLAAGGALLRSTNTNFTYTSFSRGEFINGQEQVTGTYQIPATLTNVVTLDTGQASQKVSTLRTSPGPSEIKVWDFGANFAGAPTTDTTNTYTGFNLPQSVVVKDGAGNQISSVTFGYDETPVATTSALPNHTSVSGARGNLTSKHVWINTTGGTYDTAMTYDDAGTVLTMTSPNGKASFGHDSTDTYVTSTLLPTPSSGVALQKSTTFDASTGVMTSSTDENGVQTLYQSFDSLNRAKEVDVRDASGVAAGRRTFIYSQRNTTELEFQNANTSSQIQTQFDTYGRLSRMATATGQSANNWYQNDVCYNANGDVSFRSYGYQGSGFALAQVCSGAGDAFLYDGLGRTSTVTHADQTAVRWAYRGNATQVTDESGVSRITQNDGFGRITIACELSANSSMPESGGPENCGTDLSGTGFVTRYSYNMASHMSAIVQGVQTRKFQSDTLGRTISVSEPERGFTGYSYAYNATGLVMTRQRPQANQTNPNVLVTTTYQYDSLGRLIEKSYSNGENPIIYVYDIPSNSFSASAVTPLTNTKGRLAVACKDSPAQRACVASDALGYDASGNVILKWSSTPSFNTGVSPIHKQNFTYNWVGGLLSADDGAGKTTSYGYSVANELNSIASSPSDATHPGTLISNVQNGPNGPISWQYGNGLSHVSQYDGLGRQVGWYDCSASTQINCSGGAFKDGYFRQIQGQRVTVSCTGPCANYGYDEFNRVSSRTEQSGTQNMYTYTYDRYGNRWQQNALSGGLTSSLSFDISTNRVNSPGYSYDAAGNLTSDPSGTYSYDAEGNIVQASGPSGSVTNTYDAFNRQVRNDFGTSGSATENVFTPNGQIASLWFAMSSNNSPIMGKSYWGVAPIESYIISKNMAYFPFRDGVGSEAMITDAQGNVVDQRTYLPYGDAQTLDSGSRDNSFDGFTALWDGGTSSTNHALFREYNKFQGRWNSPDPYDGNYDMTNPQSFNRYAYVGNNPLAFTDLSGLDGEGTSKGGNGSGGCIGAAETAGHNVLDDIECGTSILSLVFHFLDRPSFDGTLHPRPPSASDPSWDGNFGESLGLPVNGPGFGGTGLGGLLGLPTGGCDFGACGSGPTGFQAGAAAGVIACQFAEPCGAIADTAAIFAIGGMLVADGVAIYRGRTNVADTGITSEARELVSSGKFPSVCAALSFLQSTTRDSARLQKIKATQKAFGCRRNSTQS